MKIDLAGHAEEYASLGWALVQLEGKIPAQGKAWEQIPPMDPESAKSLWTGKSCNMGLVLGPSGVIDFELDGGDRHLYWQLAGIADDGEWPFTPAFLTGSGKPHILFRDPGGLSRRSRDGMELRAGAHQSVIPPSVHPDTGQPYRWVNDPATTPLADPPRMLLDFFAEERKGEAGDAHWKSPLAAERPLGEGEGRYQSLLSYLGMAVNQATSPEQLAAMAIAYSAVAHDPPYSDETISKHAYDLWWKWHEDVAEAEQGGLKLVRASEIRMRSITFLWKPFLQRSAFHLWVGKKGAGKGTTLTWLASQMTTGFLDEETDTVAEAKGVLWISTEDSFDIDVKPRFLAQGGDPERLLCVRQRVLLPLDEEKLRQTCLSHDVGMVIIDPIISTLEKGSDANDEASVVSAIGCLNALSDELDLTIIGVRHLGKSTDRAPLESVLGSAAWVNTPRAVLGLAQDEDTKVATLEVLAGNRVRGNVSFDFKIEEAFVDGVEEPVSKVTPIGFSGSSMAEVLKREKGSKVPLIKEWLIEVLSDGQAHIQDDLVEPCNERFGVGRRSLQRALGELKDEEVIRYIPNEVDPVTGRKMPGSKWRVALDMAGSV